MMTDESGACKMTHADLVALAVPWLRRQKRCRLVVAELVTYAPCTPDALGWDAGGMTHHVECKVSRSDLLRDKRKMSHRGGWSPGSWRWYLLAPGVSAEGVDDAWGILRPAARGIIVEREAERRDRPDKVTRTEALIMLSVIRRLDSGARLDRKSGRFAELPEPQ